MLLVMLTTRKGEGQMHLLPLQSSGCALGREEAGVMPHEAESGDMSLSRHDEVDSSGAVSTRWQKAGGPSCCRNNGFSAISFLQVLQFWIKSYRFSLFFSSSVN